jgi:hypothetical protein
MCREAPARNAAVAARIKDTNSMQRSFGPQKIACL